MRYSLEADVEGSLRIESDLTVELDGLQVELKSDEGGRLSRVVLSTSVPPERVSEVAAAVTTRAGNRDTPRPPLEEEQRLTRFLQSLESDLSFSASRYIDRIRWDYTFESAKPESDEERKLVPKIYAQFESRVTLRFPLTLDAARDILERSPRDEELIVLKAFWRDGSNEYWNKRYIQAFYNFYFVIEGRFADGKFKKSQVLDAFAKSVEMSHVTKLVLGHARADRLHWPEVQKLLIEYSYSEDIAGLQELIFSLRGELHHFSTKKKGLQGTPLSQSQFETAAWLAQQFAFWAIALQDQAALFPRPDGQWTPIQYSA